MPVYVYETIPTDASQKPESFELYQSIHDEPLVHHPKTGVPVRRVITGGLFLGKKRDLSTGKCCSTSGSCQNC